MNWAPAFVNFNGKPGDYLSGFGGSGNSIMTYGAFFYSPGPRYHERDFNYDRDLNLYYYRLGTTTEVNTTGTWLIKVTFANDPVVHDVAISVKP